MVGLWMDALFARVIAWGMGEHTKPEHTSADVIEGGRVLDSYLVDPASSHMLVSKIKPCMS